MSFATKNFSICPLASGSKGNSIFVSCGNSSFLIDAGLSGIEIQRRLAKINIKPESLTAIIITHEHSDHIKGAGVLSRRFNLPVYITPKTNSASGGLGIIKELCFFECGQSFKINNIQINPFSISHDACDPSGLTLTYKESKIGIATDLGIATNLVKQSLKNCDILYIESNHDPEMLINGPYPWPLKQRIKGRTGHLSNQDAKQLIAELKTERLKHIILAHMSEENNCPEKAVQEVSGALTGTSVALHVAGPHEPGSFIRL
jgi:phosphoribosyl 1,2-cyclic phosphodiesterase